MKKMDRYAQYGWAFSLIVVLLCSLSLLFEVPISSIFYNDGVWNIGLFVGGIVAFGLAFALLYCALLLVFPKKGLHNLKESTGAGVKHDFSSSASNRRTTHLRPISNPYERITTH
jgi:hypothetical protein